jgi:hypothetical protein
LLWHREPERFCRHVTIYPRSLLGPFGVPKPLGALKRPWLSRPQTPGTLLRRRPQPGGTPAGTSQAMKTVLYCRVSTVDQTVEHQRTQARQNGFKPDLVLADRGVSGVSTHLCERPEGRRLFDILREGDALVVRWMDRLGRRSAKRRQGDSATRICGERPVSSPDPHRMERPPDASPVPLGRRWCGGSAGVRPNCAAAEKR